MIMMLMRQAKLAGGRSLPGCWHGLQHDHDSDEAGKVSRRSITARMLAWSSRRVLLISFQQFDRGPLLEKEWNCLKLMY